jgi:hypothetical protein
MLAFWEGAGGEPHQPTCLYNPCCRCCAAGDRKYKIPRLDPLEVAELVISEGPSQGGYTLTMRDIRMHGLKDAVIQRTE